MAEAYSVEVAEAKIAVYTELLADLSPQTLDACCRAAAKTCRFFPTPADIRAQLKTTRTDLLLLQGEQAWEAYQKRIQTHSCDENGIERPLFQGGKTIYPPALDAATDYAVRACGGRLAIEYCKLDNFHFIRRDFIAAYTRYKETRGLKQLPGLTEMPKAISDALRPLLQSKEM